MIKRSKSIKSLNDPIIFVSILIIVSLFIMIYTKKYKAQTNEKFEGMNQSQNMFSSTDPVFYPTTMRTRDFQDLLSITESQINKKKMFYRFVYGEDFFYHLKPIEDWDLSDGQKYTIDKDDEIFIFKP